jgi:hypothetical protein
VLGRIPGQGEEQQGKRDGNVKKDSNHDSIEKAEDKCPLSLSGRNRGSGMMLLLLLPRHIGVSKDGEKKN